MWAYVTTAALQRMQRIRTRCLWRGKYSVRFKMGRNISLQRLIHRSKLPWMCAFHGADCSSTDVTSQPLQIQVAGAQAAWAPTSASQGGSRSRRPKTRIECHPRSTTQEKKKMSDCSEEALWEAPTLNSDACRWWPAHKDPSVSSALKKGACD